MTRTEAKSQTRRRRSVANPSAAPIALSAGGADVAPDMPARLARLRASVDAVTDLLDGMIAESERLVIAPAADDVCRNAFHLHVRLDSARQCVAAIRPFLDRLEAAAGGRRPGAPRAHPAERLAEHRPLARETDPQAH